jgi:hypothetical protein
MFWLGSLVILLAWLRAIEALRMNKATKAQGRQDAARDS